MKSVEEMCAEKLIDGKQTKNIKNLYGIIYPKKNKVLLHANKEKRKKNIFLFYF